MADPMTISAVAGLAKGLINRVWPDPIQQAEAHHKLAELEQKGDLAELNAFVRQIEGQLAINLKEAEHPSIFVAGWRPFMGWAGGAAMAYQFIIYPFLIWVWAIFQAFGKIPAGVSPPPVLETGALFSVVMGMLGIGAQRSYDKAKGTDTKKPGGN